MKVHAKFVGITTDLRQTFVPLSCSGFFFQPVCGWSLNLFHTSRRLDSVTSSAALSYRTVPCKTHPSTFESIFWHYGPVETMKRKVSQQIGYVLHTELLGSHGSNAKRILISCFPTGSQTAKKRFCVCSQCEQKLSSLSAKPLALCHLISESSGPYLGFREAPISPALSRSRFAYR